MTTRTSGVASAPIGSMPAPQWTRPYVWLARGEDRLPQRDGAGRLRGEHSRAREVGTAEGVGRAYPAHSECASTSLRPQVRKQVVENRFLFDAYTVLGESGGQGRVPRSLRG